jgi:hypothetical protein
MFKKIRVGLAVLAATGAAIAGPLALTAHADQQTGGYEPSMQEFCKQSHDDYVQETEQFAKDLNAGDLAAANRDVDLATADYSGAAKNDCDWTAALVLPKAPSARPMIIRPVRALS